MKPRGPLMIEHRLIEKVLVVAHRKAELMTPDTYDPVFIDSVVDFIRTYADRTHHGKEEDILFVALEKKHLDAKNERVMHELIDEHRQARKKVGEIVALNERYKRGEHQVAGEIKNIIIWLATFYPAHIKKEDASFFPETEKYFDDKELDQMLEHFWEFDKLMIHEKYQKLLEQLDTQSR